MIEAKKIVLILFFFGLAAMPVRLCHAQFENQIDAVQNFLETKVNPAIWHAYEEITSLIKTYRTPEGQGVSEHRFMDLTSRFVENSANGSLFVVTGKVQFEQDQPPGAVPLRATLFARDKQLLQTETVFIGNLLSESDLAAMDIETIKRRLRDPQHSDINVKKGENQSFMVIFADLPKDQIEQFSVDIPSKATQKPKG